MRMESLEVIVTGLKVEMQNILTRLDKLENLTESIHNLAKGVAVLSEKQTNTENIIKGIADDVGNLTSEVSELKDKPAKRWDTIIAALVAALVGAFVAWVIKTSTTG